jgi:hypothetical protein
MEQMELRETVDQAVVLVPGRQSDPYLLKPNQHLRV